MLQDSHPRRLHPPQSLPDAARRCFANLVATHPASHFKSGDIDLMCQWAVAASAAEQAAFEMAQPGGMVTTDAKVSPWFHVHQAATKTLSMLALRLRIGPQSRVRQQSKRMMELSQIDREAMQRAINMVRAEGPDHARWIDGRDFFEAGSLAAYHLQFQSLQLRPWESTPSWVEPADIDTLLSAPPDQTGRHRAAELLKRLSAAGLSRFEADPVAALERAEKAKPKPKSAA